MPFAPIDSIYPSKLANFGKKILNSGGLLKNSDFLSRSFWIFFFQKIIFGLIPDT